MIFICKMSAIEIIAVLYQIYDTDGSDMTIVIRNLIASL